MSTYFRIICTSDTKITVDEIIQFLQDGFFIEQPPQYVRDRDEIYDGGRLLIIHDPQKRPIIVAGNLQDELFQREIDEFLEVLERVTDEDAKTQLRMHLTQSKQIIAIEIAPQNLSQDAWHMLDSLEAYFARQLQGIVYAPDDGFFDDSLTAIYRFDNN